MGRDGAAVVDGFQEGSEAAQEALKKGDRVQTINGVDATQMAFDDVIRTPARHTPFRHH